MPNCACCDKLSESHKTVNCMICNKPYRIECANVSAAEARKIHSNTGYSWTCKNCLQVSHDLSGLRLLISALQDEIKALKNSILVPPVVSKIPLVEVEGIIQEIGERERRKNNIIVFGCEETVSESRTEQSEVDVSLIADICSTIGLVDDNMKVSRLGKYDPSQTNRKRPIKVTFSSELSVALVFRNLAKVRGNPKFSALSIFRDRTPMQIQLHKEIKAELNERLNNGETDLKIKYTRGIPTVVRSLN